MGGKVIALPSPNKDTKPSRFLQKYSKQIGVESPRALNCNLLFEIFKNIFKSITGNNIGMESISAIPDAGIMVYTRSFDSDVRHSPCPADNIFPISSITFLKLFSQLLCVFHAMK
jgi:hypothetical protein